MAAASTDQVGRVTVFVSWLINAAVLTTATLIYAGNKYGAPADGWFLTALAILGFSLAVGGFFAWVTAFALGPILRPLIRMVLGSGGG